MLVILAGLFFAGAWLAFVSCRYGVRQSFLYAGAMHTLCVVLATELFSVWGLLTRPALGIFWGIAAALVDVIGGATYRQIAQAEHRGPFANAVTILERKAPR